eukprot:TRINITY_DN34501_c0_g1_i1.p1 TRINITY_DN34501_c0_g1~~TRINITY_DN34501_c0_g1_i1.p1  ORF type:complete len:1455 (-),score=342.47 TRINITY_DN34501_c0_g1_i1:123-4262(-)
MTAEAERWLWDDPQHRVAAQIGVEPLHSLDFQQAILLWEGHLMQFRNQNNVLCRLTRALLPGSVSGAGAQGNQQNNAIGMGIDQRVTTRSVAKIIYQLRHKFHSDGMMVGQYGGMIRQIPPKILELAPEEDQSVIGKAWTLWNKFSDKVVGQAIVRPRAVGVVAPPKSTPEPAHLDSVSWATTVRKCGLDSWSGEVQSLFDAFASTAGERRMSLYEFFIALICCSKGTVGEKAIALFNLYGYVGPNRNAKHITEVTHGAGSIIEKSEGAQRLDEGQFLKAPTDGEVHKMALHFKIITFSGGASGTYEKEMGEVFIPTLNPYIYSGMGDANTRAFTIWGKEKKLPPGVFANKSSSEGGADALLAEHGVRPHIGTMQAKIKWIPDDPRKPEIGQLGICLESIHFNPRTVDAPQFKNPKVMVFTYGPQGEQIKMRRWDPRTVARKVGQNVALQAHYTEYVEFPETMRRNPITGQLWHKLGKSTGKHGWVASDDKDGQSLWCWGKEYGNQYSLEKFAFRPEVCKPMASGQSGVPAQKANTISLQACRLLTQNILARALCTITHRQAILISDQIFSRSGAVPGILDAIIVNGEIGPVRHVQEAKDEFDRTGKKWVDVKKQLIIGHEMQVAMNRGDVNILPVGLQAHEEDLRITPSLASLHIPDPFPGERKVLWVRFCRAGDGQRFNSQIRADVDGTLSAAEVHLDMEHESEAGQLQMTLSKEEFINCVLQNSLLSETLRQLSTTDNGTDGVLNGTAIKLDVTIADPTKEEADEDLMDALNVRQGILFEVWDSDVGKGIADFLGEAWLPSLGSHYIGSTPRTFCLPVQSASAEASQTRPYSRKMGTPPCTGNLFVEASWVFPAEALPEGMPETTNLTERVRRETQKHTGKLQFKILKATSLRTADKNFRRAGSDPFVRVYIRNEAFMATAEKQKIPPGFDEHGWRVSQITGMHEVIFETSVKKATRDPVWEEGTEISLMSGAFEKRSKQAAHLSITGAQKQRHQDDHDLAIIAEREELKLHFSPIQDIKPEQKNQPGYRHQVEVFMGENMHQFKAKLVKACQEEAKRESDQRRKMQFQAVADQMTYRHAVMVFVPSPKLRELAQQNRMGYEYKRLYRIEEQDPSSWQPLDTVCTFQHYAAMYSFGKNIAQRLRISDGSADYKIRNNRFRAFEEEMRQRNTRFEDTNTENECFGYAKFYHPRDGGSVEWRQACIDRPTTSSSADGVANRRFNVSFVHTPYAMINDPSLMSGAGGATRPDKVELDEESVLLAPTAPNILASAHVEIQNALKKAKGLQDQGLSDQDIVNQLNKELRSEWEKIAKDEQEIEGNQHTSRPPAITLFDVQFALKQASERAEQVAAAREEANRKPAGPGSSVGSRFGPGGSR